MGFRPDLSGTLALINCILKKMTNHYLCSMSARRERRNFFSCGDVSPFSAIKTYGSLNRSFRSAIFIEGRVFLFLICFFSICHFFFKGMSGSHTIFRVILTVLFYVHCLVEIDSTWSLFSSKASARESCKCTSSCH